MIRTLNWEKGIILILSLAVLLSVFLFAGFQQNIGIANSPDEQANFLFANAMKETWVPVLNEIDNLEANYLLHPRSISVLGSTIVPNSFLGLPVLLGIVGKVFGEFGMYFVTPLLALFGVLAWYSIIKKSFNDGRLATLSAFFLLIHPAFWYYSGRVMMHNVGFLVFIIFSLWFFVCRPVQKENWKWVNDVFAGACFAFAGALRTFELIWLVPLAVACLIAFRAHVSKERLFQFLIGVFLVLVPFLYLNNEVYGGYFTTGYQITSDTIENVAQEAVVEDSARRINPILNVLLPFGFHEKAILRHVWQYGIALYPWLTGLSLLGVIFVLVKRKELSNKKVWVALLVISSLLSAWLFAVYGSWTFNDNPDPKVFSLGNSYVRYWLPIFLLYSIFAAFAVKEIVSIVKWDWLKKVLTLVILLSVFLASGWLVIYDDDGFSPTRTSLVSFEGKLNTIIVQTESDAILIVDRSDKFVFPKRRVVVPLRSESTYASMPKFLEIAPLYYFGITLPEGDLEYLNTEKLSPQNLRIEHITTEGDESLYRIYEIE